MYDFDSVTRDEAPIAEPDMPDTEYYPPEDGDGGFFAQASEDYPDGFGI